MNTKQFKNTISNIVKLYKITKPEEYEIVKQYVKQEKAKQFNDGKIYGLDLLERHLCSIPEDLFSLLINSLNSEEIEFFNSRRGNMWFAKEFNEFSLVEKTKI